MSAPPRDPTLSDLVGPSVAGDPAALNQLLDRLRPYLYALVRRHLGPSAGGVDESSVVQKSLVRVYERFGQLKTPDVPHLLRWAGQIIRNLIADEFRAAARRPPTVTGSELASRPARPEPADIERDEDAVRVAAAMAKLSDRDRAILEMRFCDDLPDAETAVRLGTAASAVRVLRFRALRRLRTILDEPVSGDPRA